MKKLLYVGYYRENSAWGRISENIVRSLIAAGADVTTRCIRLGEPREISAEVEALESKPIEDCDTLIQHVFPDHMVGNTVFERNIAILGGDFDKEDVSTPMSNFLYADDYISVEKPNYQALQPLQIPQTEDTFKCVIIDDPANRQNTFDYVFKFHNEFESYEKVSLTIFAQNPEGLEEICNQAKMKVGKRADINRYIKDIIVPLPAGGSYPEAYIYSDFCLSHPSCPLMYAELRCYTDSGIHPLVSRGSYEQWLENPIVFQTRKMRAANNMAVNEYSFEVVGKQLLGELNV